MGKGDIATRRKGGWAGGSISTKDIKIEETAEKNINSTCKSISPHPVRLQPIPISVTVGMK